MVLLNDGAMYSIYQLSLKLFEISISITKINIKLVVNVTKINIGIEIPVTNVYVLIDISFKNITANDILFTGKITFLRKVLNKYNLQIY